MSNKGLLIIVIIILVGIFSVLILDANQSPGDQIADGFGEVTEEIGDEIDDNTDAR